MVMIQTGKVINGKVVLDEGEELKDGSVVAIVSREPDEAFALTPELEAHLLEAIEEVNRGEVVGIDELYKELDEMRRRR